ncbi:MAG: DUF5686 family protein [Bacteroidota bacterium]|nr:DUF5686 family protein [Bacteroidota bacterium]
MSIALNAQIKVSGKVVDQEGVPMPYTSVAFKGTTQGMITNEDGKFYLESDAKQVTLVISFVGFKTIEKQYGSGVYYDLNFRLEPDNMIQTVQIIGGKQPKKNNPAIDILKEVWKRKRKNGLYMFDQYQYNKYEKIQFDISNIDSTFTQRKIFKGMDFIFTHIDTSSVTGKPYLPIFINESINEVYGDNKLKKMKEILKANRNSGFGEGQNVLAFIKDLYNEYNVYDNFITIFDKSFHSPLSRFGVDIYNYVLTDSAYIGNKWCYNIAYYPRRKGELTFKGDFWVNDTTYAVSKINMTVTRSANINWVRDIYIEQEFEVVNDSVFLLSRDHFMSDFSFSKKDTSKGLYGKRTTIIRDHQFNIPKEEKFYKKEVNFHDDEIYQKDDDYWAENRFESLNRDERGIYKMLDTLKTVKRFNQIYDLASIITRGYVQLGNLDYGPVLSTFGYNDVEGLRIRVGGRTFFKVNDYWRLEGYTAYGFKDNKFKYGISGKLLLDKKSRFIISVGNRRDVEQIAANLTSTNDVLGRGLVSSPLLSRGDNSKLTDVSFSNIKLEIEPIKDVIFKVGYNYRKLESASPTFKLDYVDENGVVQSKLSQSEFNISAEYTPKIKTMGYGVERKIIDRNYAHILLNYSRGVKGMFDSDFDYHKVQFYYRHPIIIGLFGRLIPTVEIGKTFGTVPLALMNVLPGNQSFFSIPSNFNLLNYYEFITDQYATVHLEHHFNGKLFSRIPYLRDLNLREVVGLKAAIGSVSGSNKLINSSEIEYIAPTEPYWEYHVGVDNIFKVVRLDFTWRGNYRDVVDSPKYGVKIQLGFRF